MSKTLCQNVERNLSEKGLIKNSLDTVNTLNFMFRYTRIDPFYEVLRENKKYKVVCWSMNNTGLHNKIKLLHATQKQNMHMYTVIYI